MKKTIVASVLALSALTVFPNPAKACFWCDPIKGISDAIDDPGKAIENLGEALIDVPKKAFDPDNWSKSPGQGDPLFPDQNENIGGQSEGYQDGQFPPDLSDGLATSGLDVVIPSVPDEGIPEISPPPKRVPGVDIPSLPTDSFIGLTDTIGESVAPSPRFNNSNPNRSGFNSPDCPMIQGVKVCHY